MMPYTNFFTFLEREEARPVPFVVKWLNGDPLTAEDLVVNGTLDVSRKKDYPQLPDNLHVKGSLMLPTRSVFAGPNYWLASTAPIYQLPRGLRVDGELDISYSEMYVGDLPSDLRVHAIDVTNTPIEMELSRHELFERFPSLQYISTSAGRFKRNNMIFKWNR